MTAAVPDVAAFLGERAAAAPRVAIVLGSGLGGLVTSVEDAVVIPYADIPGFPEPTVEGHGGTLHLGRISGVPVVLQSGRFHLYEGFPPEQVVLPVRAFAELGVGTLIVTNAAGGLRRTFAPPALMLVADHVNLMFRAPLAGPVLPGEERFPDMAAPYDPALRDVAKRVARDAGIPLAEGVYAGVLGPNYETPAEIRMLDRLGADAVGMSTVPEVIAARARGVRVLGISTITNLAAGISPTALSHDEVLAAGREAGGWLETLVRGVVAELDAETPARAAGAR